MARFILALIVGLALLTRATVSGVVQTTAQDWFERDVRSIVQALTAGAPADLVQQLSSFPASSLGYYSPYVAAVVDIAPIMDSFHTAQYQYIPALATEEGDRFSLELNTPPSFHNPKSVLVVALPAVESPQLPPLSPVNPKNVYCAEKTELVLPVEGAPLHGDPSIVNVAGTAGRVRGHRFGKEAVVAIPPEVAGIFY
jgi:hypothetical protein